MNSIKGQIRTRIVGQRFQMLPDYVRTLSELLRAIRRNEWTETGRSRLDRVLTLYSKVDDRKLKDSVHVDAPSESHLGLKSAGHIVRTLADGTDPPNTQVNRP